MQYQQTPQGLQSLADLPTAFQPQGLALLGQQQDADQMVQQDQARQLAYDNANDPMKLRKQGLENDTMAAQLPGITAQSNIHVRTDSNQGKTNDAAIQDILGKYSSAELGRHVEDASQLGTRLSQMGEEAFSNPLGAAQRVKAELHKSGHGDLWNPDWETSHPGLLARQLSDYGSDLQKTSAKFRTAMELADAKGQFALGTASIGANAKTQAAQIAAGQRQATANALMDTKKYIATLPKGLEDYAAKMRQLATEAETPEEKKKYMDEAISAEAQKARLNAAGAQVTTGVKPFLPALGIEDQNKGRQSPGLVEGQGGTPTPAMSGAQVPGWGPGAVQNPDGSVTYNGKTYTKD